MAKGILGLILCPMLDDNLVYSLRKDADDKDIVIVDTGNQGSLMRKLDRSDIPYRTVVWEKVLSGEEVLDRGRFTILIYTTDLGLHSKPEVLRSTVEGLARDMQPIIDGIGFYLGTCGNYEWNIPAWSDSQGFKPSAMFCDKDGNLCHDCVGVNIAGGPRYLELEKKYAGHMFMFPAMAVNMDDFLAAGQADSDAAVENLTDEMREALGIEPGPDGYMRWLLTLGGYEYYLKIDTGLGDHEEFEAALKEQQRRTGLKLKIAEEGWASLQPTEDLYSRCKSFLE